MKKLVVILLFIVMGCVSTSGGSGNSYDPPKKMRHYDRYGKYEGYSIDYGDRIKHYDQMGKYKGYTKKD